jgi:hypothetical protein
VIQPQLSWALANEEDSMESAKGKRSGARLTVVIAAAVGLMLLLAAPAMAAPFATSLTASPTKTMVNFGDSPTISAILMDTVNTVAVGGEVVRVEKATSSTGPWSLLDFVTSDSGPYATGEYSLEVLPVRTTYYRFVFEGTTTYAAITSNVVTVKVKPVLGTPTCPSSVKKNKSFTVKGSVQPGAPNGPGVKIRIYHRHNGAFSKYKTAYSTTRSGTRYSVSIKIKDTGRYKFIAITATSAKFVAATSAASRMLTVTK